MDEAIQQEIFPHDRIQFDQFDNLGNHRHPNCIVKDGVKCLYVGDSFGNIHFFFDINLSGDSNKARMLSLIAIQEISVNAINQIQLMPPECQDLLIHTRDKCIRIIDFKIGDSKFIDHDVIHGTVNNRFLDLNLQKQHVEMFQVQKEIMYYQVVKMVNHIFGVIQHKHYLLIYYNLMQLVQYQMLHGIMDII